MELQLHGVDRGEIRISDDVFGQYFREALVHQVVTACHGSRPLRHRQAEDPRQVSGGGIKPWRQKGTGRARAGTSAARCGVVVARSSHRYRAATRRRSIARCTAPPCAPSCPNCSGRTA